MTPGLLDSSTLSDVIRPDERRSPQVASHLKLYLARYSQLTFSELSYFEILRGLLKKSAIAQIAQFEEFCSRSLVIPVSRPVLGRAAFLWSSGQRQGIVVDDADLLIAATAIEAGISIVTANPKHFRWIEGLDHRLAESLSGFASIPRLRAGPVQLCPLFATSGFAT